MNESERTLRRIESLLTMIVAKMGALPDKPKSAASVAAFNSVLGNSAADDIPRQVVGETRIVGPMKRARLVTRVRP